MTFKIEGIQCEGCINRIKNVLSTIKGIPSYQLSLEDKTLIVEVKKEKIIAEIIQKIENLGFEISKKSGGENMRTQSK